LGAWDSFAENESAETGEKGHKKETKKIGLLPFLQQKANGTADEDWGKKGWVLIGGGG